MSADLDVSAWSADGTDALERCGHCDNCLRDSTSYKREDKTLEAWQILKIAEEVYNLGGNVTIAGLATLSAGPRQSKIMVKQRRGPATEMQVDVDKVAGGKVNLTISVCFLSLSVRSLYEPVPFERIQRSLLYSYLSRVTWRPRYSKQNTHPVLTWFRHLPLLD